MRVPFHPYLLLVLAALFWAGNFVLGRAVHTSIPPVSLVFWRWAIALLFLIPFAAPHLHAQWPILRRSWKALALYGFLGVSCFNTFIYFALQTTTATNAVLINSTLPVLIVGLSWLLGGTLVTRRQSLGIAISLVGVITIICRADPRLLFTLRVNSGDLWVLLAVVSWAFYTFLLRRRPEGLHPFSFLAAIIVMGLIWLIPLYAWELSRGYRMVADRATFFSIIYLALFPSILAFSFWNQAVAQVGANKAGLFLHLMPVFGAILSVLFLGESFHLFHLAGISLIFSGIYLTSAA
jgi:drug/metabolite transporter (DMT)-like permease